MEIRRLQKESTYSSHIFFLKEHFIPSASLTARKVFVFKNFVRTLLRFVASHLPMNNLFSKKHLRTHLKQGRSRRKKRKRKKTGRLYVKEIENVDFDKSLRHFKGANDFDLREYDEDGKVKMQLPPHELNVLIAESVRNVSRSWSFGSIEHVRLSDPDLNTKLKEKKYLQGEKAYFGCFHVKYARTNHPDKTFNIRHMLCFMCKGTVWFQKLGREKVSTVHLFFHSMITHEYAETDSHAMLDHRYNQALDSLLGI